METKNEVERPGLGKKYLKNGTERGGCLGQTEVAEKGCRWGQVPAWKQMVVVVSTV